jgi:predicted phosphodiesterase
MHIAVISDLHLGRGGPTDAFEHDDHEFLRFLSFLESNFQRIVLLGDIWETLTAPAPGGQAAELKAAQEYHGEIFQRFQKPAYRYVHGNHDLVAGPVMGAPEEYALEADGVRMLFSHGHQGDRLCSHARSVSELGVWLGAWLRRFGLDSLYRLIAGWETARSGLPEDCSVRRWALSQATTYAADIVVTGHTHVATKAESGSRLFLNSGTCSNGNISFLALDSRQGHYEVHHGY